MNFLIRADASLAIGSGHIMRCLTLARALKADGHGVHFVCRALSGHLADWIRAQGFACSLLEPDTASSQPENPAPPVASAPPHAHWLPLPQEQDAADCAPLIAAQRPDWIICDHYALDAVWQRAARAVCGSRLMVIDDLCDRAHDADLLLDQTLNRRRQDYAGLLPAGCRVLAGTRYALLRDEFAAARPAALAARAATSKQPESRILLNLGGVDEHNYTLAVLKALQPLAGSLKFALTVVMGATAPHTAAVREFAAAAPYPCRVLSAADNMAQLMAQADLAIGAAGSTSWERCCLGLPTLLLVLADNQRAVAAALQQAGAALVLETQELSAPAFAAALRELQKRQPEMSQAAAALCDGLGVQRVLRHLDADADFQAAFVRPVREEDSALIHRWRNHPDIRRFMFDNCEIPWPNHEQWFARALADPDFAMLVYCAGGQPLGYASFRRRDKGVYEWGFYTAPDAPRGHGTRLGRLALQYAFAELGARRVLARVLPHNAASLALHRKLGFAEGQPENDGSRCFALEAADFAD